MAFFIPKIKNQKGAHPMNLTENEKRMVYQVESTCQATILNEIAMNKRYAPTPEIRQTAESLLSKLRLLSDKECMALVNDVQKNYRLPGKARTIGKCLRRQGKSPGRRNWPAMTLWLWSVLTLTPAT